MPTRSNTEAKEQRQKENKKIAGMLQRVFQSEDGGEFMKWLEKVCMANEQTIVLGSFDATAFNEGKRAVLLRVKQILEMKLI